MPTPTAVPGLPPLDLRCEALKVLTSPVRIRLLLRLVEGPATMPQLHAAADQCGPAAVRDHLAGLVRAGLVTAERTGRGGRGRLQYAIAEGLVALTPRGRLHVCLDGDAVAVTITVAPPTDRRPPLNPKEETR